MWPEFYFKNMVTYSIAAAVVGAILAGFLNVCEHAFDRPTPFVKAGITCCLPLAVGVGLASVVLAWIDAARLTMADWSASIGLSLSDNNVATQAAGTQATA